MKTPPVINNRKLPIGAVDRNAKIAVPSKIPTLAEINSKPKLYKAVSFFSGIGGSSVGLKWAGFDVIYANEFIPNAAHNYRLNAPGTKVDSRDIRKIDGSKLLKKLGLKRGQLDLMDASPPCFVPGTLVATLNGYIPIEKVTTNDKVLSHKGRYCQVSSTMLRKTTTTVYDLRFGYGESLSATGEHPFLVRERAVDESSWRSGISEPLWVEAKSLKVGDYVAVGMARKEKAYQWGGVPKGFVHRISKEFVETGRVITLPTKSRDFWYIVGRWLGDGWTRHRFNTVNDLHSKKYKKPRAEIFICCDKTDGGKELNEIISRLDRLGIHYGYAEYPTAYKIIFTSKEWCVFLGQFGSGAANKYVPAFVHELPLPLQKSFLHGYLHSDGYCMATESGRVRGFSTTSRNLAYGISQVVAKVFGNVPTKFVVCKNNTFQIEGRTVRTKPIWRMQFRSYRDEKTHSFVDEKGVVWVPIREIQRRKYTGFVHNLSVEKDETYTANGIVVHNCKLFSPAQARKQGAELGMVLPYSEGVDQRVDDLFFEAIRILKDFMPKVFIMENVEGLAEHVNRGILVEILDGMENSGYVVEARILDGSRMGIPQKRRRLIFVGVRKDLYRKYGIKPVFPKPQANEAYVSDFLPHIEKVKTAAGFKYAKRAYDAITASDHSIGFTGLFSRGGWVQTHNGTYRRFTINELYRMFGFPDDFQLEGSFVQRWERIGRSHSPVMMHSVARLLKKQLDSIK